VNAIIPPQADPRGDPVLLNTLFSRMQHSRATFVVAEQGARRTVTAQDILGNVARVLATLQDDFNLSPRDRVGILADNGFDWIIMDLACIAGGMIVVPFDPQGAYEVDELMSFFALALLVTDQDKHVGARPDVVSIGSVCGRKSAERPFQPYRYARNDILAVKFTSGSTQQPKAMEAKAINCENSMANVQRLFRHDIADRVLIFLPLYLLQQRFWIYSAILFDYHVILTTPTLALMLLQRERPTVIMGVPEFFEVIKQQFMRETRRRRLLRYALPAYRRLNAISGLRLARIGFRPFLRHLGGSVRYLWTGSAACSLETLTFYRDMGVDLLQGYGMNETCIVSKNTPGANRIGSAGRVLPNYEVVFDRDQQILVRAACEVNTSYYRAAEASAETFAPDGTVRTGDLGYLDGDGYLYITGRKKEMIVLTSGKKIAPQPVEALLRQSRLIENCMLVGSDHPYCTAIIHPADPTIDRSALEHEIGHTNKKLAREERIVRFIVSSEGFTRENGMLTSQYKLRRNRIVERYADEIATLY
jgi:long-chain acyl-CoA synthetase